MVTPGTTYRRAILIGIAICAISSAAWANDFLFSAATAPVVGIAFLGWLFSGLVVWLIRKADFTFIGWSAIFVFILVPVIMFGHIEFVLMIWMFYVGLLTVYYMFPRKGVSASSRKLNLIFHGSFLAVIIIGGVLAKAIYWSNLGGFSAWSRWMKEIMPGFAVIYVILTALVALRIYFGVAKRGQTGPGEEQEVSPSSSQ